MYPEIKSNKAIHKRNSSVPTLNTIVHFKRNIAAKRIQKFFRAFLLYQEMRKQAEKNYEV